jgi:hypothetical protein
MVVECSDAVTGNTAPADPPALFNVPSASTITQLFPHGARGLGEAALPYFSSLRALLFTATDPAHWR